MLTSVQLLRFIAAFLVVLTHTLGEYEWSRPFGSFGVDIFFVISGFIIYVITDKDFEYFLRKRLIRIVPMYWVFTLGVAAIALLRHVDRLADLPTHNCQGRGHLLLECFLVKRLTLLWFRVAVVLLLLLGD